MSVLGVTVTLKEVNNILNVFGTNVFVVLFLFDGLFSQLVVD